VPEPRRLLLTHKSARRHCRLDSPGQGHRPDLYRPVRCRRGHHGTEPLGKQSHIVPASKIKQAGPVEQIKLTYGRGLRRPEPQEQFTSLPIFTEISRYRRASGFR
jgi:hypothetical protein